MSQAGKNLKYLRKLRGWTQEEFANKLNIKRSLLGAYEEERADPRIEVLEVISGLFKISLDELLLKDVSAAKGNYLDRRQHLKLMGSIGEIRYVPVKAAAGYMTGYADPEFVDELNTFTLPMLGAGSYRAFEIIGDSMLPTQSGSVIVGEKLEQLDSVKTSNTYIVVSKNDGIVYKRVVRNNKTKNKVTLVSDNPTFEPYQINADEILELWQAQVIISKANVQQRWDANQLANVVNNINDQGNASKRKIVR